MKIHHFLLYFVLCVESISIRAAASSRGYPIEAPDALCRRVAAVHNEFFEKPIISTSSKTLREAFDRFKATYDGHATSKVEVNLEGLSSRQRVRLMRAITNHKLLKKPSHTGHKNCFWGHDPAAAPDEKKHMDLIPTVFKFGNASLTVQNQYFYVWDERTRRFVANQPGNFFAAELGAYDDEYDDLVDLVTETQGLREPQNEREERQVLKSPLATYILNAITQARRGRSYSPAVVQGQTRGMLARSATAEDVKDIAETINLYGMVFDLEIARRLTDGDIYRPTLPIGVGIDLILQQALPWDHLFLYEDPLHLFSGYGGFGHPESRVTKFQNLCRTSKVAYLGDNTKLRRRLMEAYCKTADGDESDTEGADVAVVEYSAAGGAGAGAGGSSSSSIASGAREQRRPAAIPIATAPQMVRMGAGMSGSGAPRDFVPFSGAGHAVASSVALGVTASQLARRRSAIGGFVPFSGAGYKVGSSAAASVAEARRGEAMSSSSSSVSYSRGTVSAGTVGVSVGSSAAAVSDSASIVGVKRPREPGSSTQQPVANDDIIVVDDEDEKGAKADAAKASAPDAKRGRASGAEPLGEK